MVIGFIGLGAMGLPMIRNLLEKGYEVYCYDVSEAALIAAQKLNARPLASAAAVGENADAVFLSLPNANIVRGVLTGMLSSGQRKTRYVADLSSIAPGSAQEFAALCEESGVEYADCPVSGGVAGAEKGALTIMAGAKPETLEALRPVLNVLGKELYHVGGVGLGSAMKMINNFLLGCNMAAVAEALALAKKLGLSASAVQEIVQKSSGRSFIMEAKVPNFIIPRKFTGGFQIDLEYKDLGLSAQTAKELKTPIPMGSMAVQVFEMARAMGLGKEDISAVVKVWESMDNE